MEAISLFTGIGGFEIALGQVFNGDIKVIQMVEIDPDAQKVLKHHFSGIPIHSDICTYHPNVNWNYETGIIFGGWPCTNTSCAGDRTGLTGRESRLYFEMLRIITTTKPRFVLMENPTGLINNGLRAVLGGLRMAGYSTETEIISAAEVGASHERERLFIIAYPNHLPQGQHGMPPGWDEQIRAEIEALHSQGRQATPSSVGMDDGVPSWLGGTNIGGVWRNNLHSAPTYPGTGHHIANRRSCVDLYGRAVIPDCAAIAFRRIKFLHEWWKDV